MLVCLVKFSLGRVTKNQAVKIWIVPEGVQVVIMLCTNTQAGLKVQSTLERL